MKKLVLAAIAVVAAFAFSACGNKAPKANLNSEIDSLSYAYGVVSTTGLEDYLRQMYGLDSIDTDEFIKGMLEGANAGDDKKKAAYYAGVQIGQQISNNMLSRINYEIFGEDSTQSISLKNFLAGFIASYKKDSTTMAPEKAMAVVEIKQMAARQKQQEQMMKKMEQEAIAKYADNKKAGEDFLAENAKKEGVTTLNSGVQYKVIKAGNGEKPKASSEVTAFYELRLIDGTIIESNFGKEPATFPLNGVIPGWTEVLQLMPVGSTWEVYIPQNKAYGPQDKGTIKPFSALIFKINLVGTKN